MAIAIAVVLAGVAGFLLWLGHRAWRQMAGSAGRLVEARPEAREIRMPQRPPRADALVYLFGHCFARPPRPGRSAGRLAAFDPMTGQELEAREWAAKMLFALITEEREAGTMEFRIVERTPTMMPPFPHKNWELELRRLESPASSPLGDCLNVAFDMVERRAQRREATHTEEGQELRLTEEAQWYPLDLLVEKMLQVVRTETGFWEREGIYGDLRNYVVDALIAEGYLVEKGGDTLIDHFRRRKSEPIRETIEPVAPAAEALLRRLHVVRQRFGSAIFLAEEEPEVTYTHQNAPASLITLEDPAGSLLWADALGISIYETLVALRQLEPAGEGGL